MLATLLALVPVVSLIVLGHVLYRLRFPQPEFWRGVDSLVYRVLFPVYLFMSAARSDFSALQPVLSATVLLLPVAVVTAALVLLAQRGALAGRTTAVVLQAAIRQNVYVAIGLATPLIGPEAAGPMALAVAFSVPSVNAISAWALTRWAPSERPPTGALRAIATNPLILASAAGIAVSASGFALPALVAAPLGLVAQASLPMALLGVGAGLQLAMPFHAAVPVALAAVLKLAVLPAATLGLALALRLDPTLATTLSLFAATPTSSAAYAQTRIMGGDAELMAATITAQTVAALLTVPLAFTAIRLVIPA